MMAARLQINIQNVFGGDFTMIGFKESPLGMQLSAGSMESLSEDPGSTDEDRPHEGAIADLAAPLGSEAQAPVHKGGIWHTESIEEPQKTVVPLLYYGDMERRENGFKKPRFRWHVIA